MKCVFPSAVLLTLLLITVPGQAEPQSETVIVEGSNALPGIWRFPPHERRSDWSKKGTNVVANFAAMGPEKYCRIGRAEPGYTFNCLEIAERFPRARLGLRRHVDLSWAVLFGVPGCRWTFQGRLQSDTEIAGHLGMMCGMVLREKPEAMTITKLVLSENAPDVGGQSAYLKTLLAEMANGEVTEPYVQPHFISSDPAVEPLPDDVQHQLLMFLTPSQLRSLGKVTAVIYVAEYVPIAGWSYSQASPVHSEKRSSIYAVEFENGERLCALHRRSDGVLDIFQCI